MKSFLTLLLVACFANYVYGEIGYIPPPIADQFATCQKQLRIEDEDVQKMAKKKDYDGAGCLYACLFKELGVMTADGQILGDKMEAIAQKLNNKDVPEAVVSAVSADCQSRSAGESDACKVASTIMACVGEYESALEG